jgi:glycerol-3-phosphate dehydrogenase
MLDFDLFIIGGGINGAGIARDAAGRGLRVALAEQEDFGGATSSASSKLIHGGLRYLEHFEFKLVTESLAEREVLLRSAPHLIRPLQFVLPHARGLRPAWMIRCGLWLYDLLGGRGSLPRSQAAALQGGVLKPAFRRGFSYWDARADDARLVIANLRSAADHGARLWSRTRCVGAQVEEGRWIVRLRRPDGNEEECRARMVINASGPWAAHVLGALRGQAKAEVRLVKGSHIVVPRVHDKPHAYILQNRDKRVLFIIPFEAHYSLIGTTELVVRSAEEGQHIAAVEIAYLLDAANAYLARPLSASDIRWTYSGVRPLYDDGSQDASAVTRDYIFKLELHEGAPLLNVYGGKLTTYRKLAEAALRKLKPWLNPAGGPWTEAEALPGAYARESEEALFAALRAQYARLPESLLRAVFGRHGSLSAQVLSDARETSDLGRHFGADLYEREARYFIEHEWALEAEDILWRRSKAGLHLTELERKAFAAWFESAA